MGLVLLCLEELAILFLCEAPGGFQHSTLQGGAAVQHQLSALRPSATELPLCDSLQVFGSFLLPFWVCYRRQLRNRRQWRQGIIKRRSDSQDGASLPPDCDPGLDIRPTWSLYLPQSLAFLVVSFVAGSDFKVLQYML